MIIVQRKGTVVFLGKADWEDIRDPYFSYICNHLGIRPHASGVGAESVDTFKCSYPVSALDLSRFGIYLANHFKKYRKAFLFFPASALEALEKENSLQSIENAPIPWEAYVIYSEKRFGPFESSEWIAMEERQAIMLSSWSASPQTG